MDTFKTYLSNKGGVLAQCQEFAVYCALPYIPNPASHSSFNHLFTVSGDIILLFYQLIDFVVLTGNLEQ